MSKLGDRRTDEKTGAIMVYVPEGTVQGFWLDLTPVTNAAYAKFVADGGYERSDLWTEAGWMWRAQNRVIAPVSYTDVTAPDQPRVGVTWYEAKAFAAWRGGRLPTEVEWEWAARGPEKRVYAWGNEWQGYRTYVHWRNTNSGYAAVVGENIRLNGAAWCGALDMCGNVWEWTNSVYTYMSAGQLLQDDRMRVLRGGSFINDRDSLTCDVRASSLARCFSQFEGFRVVVNA